jgi:hypothetical protein
MSYFLVLIFYKEVTEQFYSRYPPSQRHTDTLYQNSDTSQCTVVLLCILLSGYAFLNAMNSNI